MEAIEVCLKTLNSIQYYLKMLLTDTSYDPHVSTLSHINKLSDLCSQALESNEVQELAHEYEELYPDLAGKIIISCSACGPQKGKRLGSLGVVFKFPGPSSHLNRQIDRVVQVSAEDLANYDAIYEAISSFKTFGTGGARAIEIRTDNSLVAGQLQEDLGAVEARLYHHYKSVQSTLIEARRELQIPIEIVYYPPNSTKDLRYAQELAQDALGLKNY